MMMKTNSHAHVSQLHNDNDETLLMKRLAEESSLNGINRNLSSNLGNSLGNSLGGLQLGSNHGHGGLGAANHQQQLNQQLTDHANSLAALRRYSEEVVEEGEESRSMMMMMSNHSHNSNHNNNHNNNLHNHNHNNRNNHNDNNSIVSGRESVNSATSSHASLVPVPLHAAAGNYSSP